MNWEVPPPDKVPIDELASVYGLADGLRVEGTDRQWRCACCSQMQNPDFPQVWVPEGTLCGDPAWSVTESCRKMAYNGEFSAWCLGCAPKKVPPTKPSLIGKFRNWIGQRQATKAAKAPAAKAPAKSSNVAQEEEMLLKGWHMAFCPIHECNWMFIPNDRNNRECPACQDDKKRKVQA